MLRRTAITTLLAASAAAADGRTDALDAVEPLASALSDGDAGAFMARIPQDAPNYSELAANVRALVAQTRTTSSVTVLKVGSGAADLDWYLEIRSRATDMSLERRRSIVRIEFAGRKLRRIEPAGFFAPPKVEP